MNPPLNQLTNGHLDTNLLETFTKGRIARSFARLALAAGKLPVTRHRLPCQTLADQIRALALDQSNANLGRTFVIDRIQVMVSQRLASTPGNLERWPIDDTRIEQDIEFHGS